MVTQDPSDTRALVGAARRGDRDAFAALVAPHERALRAYLRRATGSPDAAADLAQDALLRAFERLPTFRGDASFRTWLFRIASNAAIDWLRARARWSEHAQDTARAAAIASPEFRDTLGRVAAGEDARFEVREHVSHCLTCVARTLPPDQQLALLLRELCDFGDAEGAAVLGRTEAAFKHLVHDARRTMTEVFERRCALVGKGGACWQCRELGDLLRGPEETAHQLETLGDRAATLDGRLDVARAADRSEPAGRALHAFLLRQLRGANGYD